MKQFHQVLATVFVSLSVVGGAHAATSQHKTDSRKDALLVELTGKDPARLMDTELYSEIVGAYQADDELALKSRLQSFLARFPQSAFADNALYLAGRMALDHKNYAEAVKFFSQVTDKYPNSEKVAAAQFAKGMAYKKMNLKDIAKNVLSSVRTKYPGSPESFRAENELKLIK